MLAFESCHKYLTVLVYVPHVKWAKIPLTILWNPFLDKMRVSEWSRALPLAGPRLLILVSPRKALSGFPGYVISCFCLE